MPAFPTQPRDRSYAGCLLTPTRPTLHALLPGGIEIPDRFGGWVLAHRPQVLVVVAIVTTLAVIKTAQIPMQPSLVEGLVADPTELREYQRQSSEFGEQGDDRIYVAAIEGDALFTPDKLNAIRRAAQQLSQLPAVTGVTCLPDAYWVDQPDRLSAGQIAAPACCGGGSRTALGTKNSIA